MQEEIENKTLSLIINTSKFTERTLATAFAKALKLGWNKAKEHYQAKPQGRIRALSRLHWLTGRR